MSRQMEFLEKPPRARRVLMHVVDAGMAPNGKHIAHFVCSRCNHDGLWHYVNTVSEAKRGLPCPKCNKQG
jgi:DNA-directed RNA polymerase subunit RPC12/RpoP